MAFGTIGLFVFALHDPIAFAERMAGLAAVPDPLWWLLGAIVSFYFGAREMHHSRDRAVPSPEAIGQVVRNIEAIRGLRVEEPYLVGERGAKFVMPENGTNPALAEWHNLFGDRKGLDQPFTG